MTAKCASRSLAPGLARKELAARFESEFDSMAEWLVAQLQQLGISRICIGSSLMPHTGNFPADNVRAAQATFQRELQEAGFCISQDSSCQETSPAQVDWTRGQGHEAEIAESASHGFMLAMGELQCLQRKELANFLLELNQSQVTHALLSLRTLPAPEHNKDSPTLLPLSTWSQLLEWAGFRLIAEYSVNESTPESQASDADCFSQSAWSQLNPFRELDVRQRHFWIIERRETPSTNTAEMLCELRRVLGIRGETPGQIRVGERMFFSFLLGHYQEFLLFQPFFDILPRDAGRVLIRSGAFDAIENHRRQSMLAYLKARGIEFQTLTGVESLDWQAPAGRPQHALITAIDSNANQSHLLNSAILLDAQSEGILTFQLQHGIWPHAEFPQRLTVFAEHLLTWSEDFERPFEIDPLQQVSLTGCPRFDAYNPEESSATVGELLGRWTDRYEHTVMMATNLHWPLHTKGSEVLPQLARTAEELPDVLFICKLHPAHDYESSTFQGFPENVVIVDEFASLYGELDTPRLVRASDAVVCTLSTVALESALAEKPFAILDTENRNRYEHAPLVAIDSLTSTVQKLLREPTFNASDFVCAYYDVPNLFGATQRVLNAIEGSLACREPRPATARALGTRALVRELLSATEAKHQLEKELQTLNSQIAAASATQLRSADSATATNCMEEAQPPANPCQAPPQRSSWSLRKLFSPRKSKPQSCQASGGLLGKINSRDEIPLLLSELGLQGLGVELGVAAGDYSNHLLTHSQLRVLFSVDRWSDHHDDQECALATGQLAKHGVRSSVLRMTFDEALAVFADSTFDFIYFDGYAHTGQDGIDTLEKWWNKLRPGGLFAGHDYHPSWQPTVDVVDRFVARHQLTLFTTREDPSQVEHAYPSWYLQKAA